LKDREGNSIEVDPGATSGDYLTGFYLGTRQALFESGRLSITLTIEQVDAFHVGVLIALYERAVGLYASLININAYHQPGVEAGKKAAGVVLQLQAAVLDYLSRNGSNAFSAEQIAAGIQKAGAVETVFKICQHLAANRRIAHASGQGLETKFQATKK
jgi:glucose-6-phosphate isomerase